MSVTIKAKGVYDPNSVQGAAGWGAVIEVTGKPLVIRGGPIDQGIRGSTEAEVVAIANGLSAARQLEVFGRKLEVTVHGDCREVVAVLLRLIPSARCTGKDAIDPAITVRRDLRESASLERFLEDVRATGILLNLVIEKADVRALQMARDGMNLVRARR